MKGRRRAIPIAIFLTAIALFVVLWRVTGPFRLRHQFETQALARLQGTRSPQGGQFDSLRINKFSYDAGSGQYKVAYELKYKNGKGQTNSEWSACTLYPYDGAYEGDCFATSAPHNAFKISVHE